MKYQLSAFTSMLILSACATQPHARTLSSVSIEAPVTVQISTAIVSMKRVQEDSTAAFDGEIEAYDAEGHLRLDLRGGMNVTIYNYLSSSGVWGDKKFLSEAEGQSLAKLITTTRVKGCKVDLVFDHEGNLISVKGNCDPMAAASGENEST